MELDNGPKILLSISIALSISFLIFYIVSSQIVMDLQNTKNEHNLYSRFISPNPNRVFLIGSSQTVMLNSTLIEDHLSQLNEYDVYNLAFDGDYPSERLKSVDSIISNKP